MDSNTKMNASMKDQYIDRFFEATMNGNEDIVRQLLKAITDVDVKNERGWTALMFASRNGHVRVVKALLENKANKEVINSSGQTAVDIAKFWNHVEVVQLLLGDTPAVSLYKDRQKDLVNFFGACPIDRAADKRKDKAWLDKTMKDKTTNYILLSELNAVAVAEADNSVTNPQAAKFKLCIAGYDDIKDHVSNKDPLIVFLGIETVKLAMPPSKQDSSKPEGPETTVAWFAVDVTGIAEADLHKIHPQAEILGIFPGAMSLTPDHGAIYAQARSTMAWHDRYQFCPTCGAKTSVKDAGYKRECSVTECRSLKGVHNTSYPRVDPTTIMAVVSPDGKKLLLGRGARFPKGMYSCLAGFIEPGETVEAACRREVMEESGIQVGRVEYHSSQPWPMPCSLMIGCLAYAVTEKIKVDKDELEDAKWFTRQDVVQMLTHKHPEKFFCPPEQAIAHQLIRTWVNMTSNL